MIDCPKDKANTDDNKPLDNEENTASITKKYRKSKWTPEEDRLLEIYAQKYHLKNWKEISKHIEGKNASQCLDRWSNVLNPALTKGYWSPEEDAKLAEWVSTIG